MSGELIVGGDPEPHRHDLPPVPSTVRSIIDRDGVFQAKMVWSEENAVARCPGCRLLFVSRLDPEGWGRTVVWVRLRWWHRAARRKLRERR